MARIANRLLAAVRGVPAPCEGHRKGPSERRERSFASCTSQVTISTFDIVHQGHADRRMVEESMAGRRVSMHQVTVVGSFRGRGGGQRKSLTWIERCPRIRSINRGPRHFLFSNSTQCQQDASACLGPRPMPQPPAEIIGYSRRLASLPHAVGMLQTTPHAFDSIGSTRPRQSNATAFLSQRFPLHPHCTGPADLSIDRDQQQAHQR